MTKQVWFITGGKGSGKSTAIATFPRPSELSKMVVFDTEDSMSDILDQHQRLGVSFGRYIRAYDRLQSYLGLKGKKEADEWNAQLLTNIAQGKLPWRNEAEKFGLAEYWEWFLSQLDAHLTPPGKFKFLGIDTIEPIEAGCAAWAEKNKKQSGYRNMVYAQGEIEAIRPLLENTIEAIHQRGVEHVLLSSHTKSPWVNVGGKSRPVYDRVKPGGRLKVWSRISTAMLWMVKPPYPANANNAPSAVVLKARQGKLDIHESQDEWVPSSPIPPRIPAFSWAVWRQYKEKGWNPLDPQPGETVLPEEHEMMSELLSQKEYQLMIAEQQAALAEERNHKSVFSDSEPLTVTGGWKERAIAMVKEFKASGKDITGDVLKHIAEEIKKPVPVLKAELKDVLQ